MSKSKIEQFFTSGAYAVVGASKDRTKFGNKVLRCYLQNNLQVTPVHPLEKEIEGVACVNKLSQLNPEVKSISVITPPAITEKIVEEAQQQGIKNIWMQPGASSPEAIKKCQEYGINVVADGSCVLVELGFFS